MKCVVCGRDGFKGVGGLYKHYCKVHFEGTRSGRMNKFKCFVRDCRVDPVK